MYIVKLFINRSTHNTIICGTIHVQTIDGKIYTFLIWKLWKLYAYTYRKKLQRTRQRMMHWIEMLLTWWHNNSPRSNVFEKWCTAIKCSFFSFSYTYSYKVVLLVYALFHRELYVTYVCEFRIFYWYLNVITSLWFVSNFMDAFWRVSHNICKFLHQNISGIIS